MFSRTAAVAAMLVAAGCSDGGGTTNDASPDTPPDMATGCGADLFFTGEIVDWDSQGECGVADATITVRQDAMFTQIGEAYNGTRAQLVVRVAGTQRAVSIAASHAATQRHNGAAWEPGDTGGYVLFPNVAPGATQLSVAGGAVGTGMITLEAGAYTYVTVIAN
jgi:hypothetical protein